MDQSIQKIFNLILKTEALQVMAELSTGKLRYNEIWCTKTLSEQDTLFEATDAVRSGQANIDTANPYVQQWLFFGRNNGQLTPKIIYFII